MALLRARAFVCCPSLLAALLAGCGGELNGDDGATTTQTPTCDPAALAFETGDADGHADPFGAKAAKQARAGRILAKDVPQPAHGRQRIEDGDFVLANEKVAFFIEDKDLSDGYGRFGGEVLAVDRVGDDGKPLGLSKFQETLMGTSLYQVNPTSVTVLNDGSDGKAAVVRSTGKLEAIPFLKDTFGGAFPTQYEGLEAAYDFVLEPGAERLSVRFGFINPTEYDVDTGLNFEGSADLLGFFQGSFNHRFTPGLGFDKASGAAAFIGFENDTLPFAYVGPDGAALDFGGIDISGFQVFTGPGMVVKACSVSMVEDHQIVAGEPHGGVDQLGEVVRRTLGQPAWREVTGIVKDGAGQPVEGANVHALAASGSYLSRVQTGADGSYTIHVPPEAVTLVPEKRGLPQSAGSEIGVSEATSDLTFDANGFIHVVATESGSGVPIPVRVQIIPTQSLASTPDAFGVPDETNGRLWQDFSVSGDTTLAVPPGNHRVVVSHGFEYEMIDTTVDVAAGATVDVSASLLRSVDTTGAISADFHIHSMFSADSSDPVSFKVRGSLADGVESPVSSEHEWINPFQPTIDAFGAQDWAFGIPSEELTTFTWGHFGVVPINPRPERVNNGAIDWLGKSAQEVFDEVHALPESPALIVNHPSGDTKFSAYFTAVQLDRATGSSTDALWSESFDAIEVFNDSDLESNRDQSVADWFALLNSGKTFWSVGSSDSHSLRTSPVGYPRTYLAVGYDDPKLGTADDVRDAIVQGRMTVSGGLYITVAGPNGAGPGDIEMKTATADFTVTVQCPSWMSADTLETIVDGVTVSTEPLAPVGGGPGKRFVNQVTVNLGNGPRSWVVFHAKGSGDLAPLHPGRHPFAVSNPVLFQ